MSWLARSLVSSLRADHGDSDDEDDEVSARKEEERSHRAAEEEESEDQQPIEPGTPTRGVKEDISELTKTLTRQFWGVASFLAPPPTSSSSSQIPTSPPHPDSSTGDRSLRTDPEPSGGSDVGEADDSPTFAGIRSDFAEIGGRFRSGISMLSSNKAVTEISKIASTFLPFGSDEVDEEEDGDEESDVGAVGVTDEVLAFVRNVSMHPETWLDFPLLPDDEESDDFYMSDAQQEHALAIEHFVPRLAALRIELCPSHMSEGCFWKIYFVLLHPRLNKHDAEILSTPQIVQARTMLLQDVQNRARRNPERSESEVSYPEETTISASPEDNVQPSPNVYDGTTPLNALTPEETTPDSVPLTEFETEKHPIQATVVKIVEKSVIEEGPSAYSKIKTFPGDRSEIPIQRYEDGDEWLVEETGEMGVSDSTSVPLGDDEDVSFSDLEEDEDDGGARTGSKPATPAIDSLTKDESGWVQLNKKGGDSSAPQTKEPNDWLDVDIDAD